MGFIRLSCNYFFWSRKGSTIWDQVGWGCGLIGGIRVHYFGGTSHPKGYPLWPSQNAFFLNKESNKEHAFSNLQTSWDFSGFGGFSEMIVLKSMYIYIYIYMPVNKCKFHIYNIYRYICIYIKYVYIRRRMGLFIWDPLSSIPSSPGLFINNSRLFINHWRLD